MSLSTLYRGTRSLEAIENYGIATTWQPSRDISQPSPLKNRSVRLSPSGISRRSSTNLRRENADHYIYSDNDFWDIILASPDGTYGHSFHFYYCALSEWVARVPGLFWSRGADALRKLAESAIDFKSVEWTVYHPLGKSQLVLGGIGTYKFSPDGMGNHLVTLSCGHNASSGIPAIISPEVWEHYQLGEGDILTIEAKWHEMPQGWAERFPSIRGIPRGCLVIRYPKQVRVSERKQPVQFHPCTVMEYYSGDAILYDFVYATADTSLTDYRQMLEKFFEVYKARNERYGKYLIPADQSHPLFDAEYPISSIPEGQFQVKLIEERVRQRSFNGQTIDELLQALASNCSNYDLQELSRDIRLNPHVWFRTDAAAARSAAQLLEICIQRNKVEELVDALALRKSTLIA